VDGGVAAGCWLLAAGCWLLAAGCWLLAAGCWLLATGCLSPWLCRVRSLESRTRFLIRIIAARGSRLAARGSHHSPGFLILSTCLKILICWPRAAGSRAYDSNYRAAHIHMRPVLASIAKLGTLAAGCWLPKPVALPCAKFGEPYPFFDKNYPLSGLSVIGPDSLGG